MNFDLAGLRLANQQINRHPSGTPAQVMTGMGAMQAQDYAGALWALGLRLTGATQTDIEAAIAKRQIIRTWPMRGTLHFVPAVDIGWMLELLAARQVRGAAGRRQRLGLDDATLNRSEKIFQTALAGSKVLTRPKMIQLLEESGISTGGQRGIHILGNLSQRGILCFGPHEGKQPTFALLPDWAPQAVKLDPDQALAEITRRFFTSHGPATTQDLMRWGSLTAREVRQGLELTKGLKSFELDGTTYWGPARQPQPGPNAPTAHLLPGFDEYMLGYKDRSFALHADHSQKIVPGNNGMFLPTIVINGQVRGIWRRLAKKDKLIISLAPFQKLSKTELKSVDDAAQRYGQFLQTSVELKI